jgi:hypothetical protein
VHSSFSPARQKSIRVPFSKDLLAAIQPRWLWRQGASLQEDMIRAAISDPSERAKIACVPKVDRAAVG